MVDVHAGEPFPAVHDKVDEILQGLLLFGSREGPLAPVHGLAGVTRRYVAEKVFEAVLTHERIALQIEEDVAVRRFREQ